MGQFQPQSNVVQSSVTQQEFERYRRFRDEQYKNLGIKVTQLEEALKVYNPTGTVAPKTRDLLARQVDIMFRKIQFLDNIIIKICKKLGIPIGTK